MKRLLLIIACLLCFSHSAFAATANVQCVHGDWSSGLTYDTTLTATNGNLLWVVVHFIAGDTGNTIDALGDGGTNTYTSIDAHTFNSLGVAFDQNIYYAKNITGGALTITTTLDTTNVLFSRTDVCEVSGADTTAPLDQTAINPQSNPGTGADAVTSGAVTTGSNGEYIAGSTIPNGNSSVAAGTGFTAASTGLSGYLGIAEYKLQASAGSVAATFTDAVTGGALDYYTVVATFKAAGGGGATCNGGLLLLAAGGC